ncbi:excisionase family DNA-binding protein, partial [Streptomyces actinomycinicus]
MHAYRIGDAAALLGVSAGTVRRLVDSGKLTAERDGLGRRSAASRLKSWSWSPV